MHLVEIYCGEQIYLILHTPQNFFKLAYFNMKKCIAHHKIEGVPIQH